MSSTIQLLPDSLINQIAAGEVIENPSSVVKELVENSIDAKASHIEIEIKGGGLQQIVIHDDGIGMSPEDLLLSIQRHATSKIKHFTDLSSLVSMGFRGEAMASIASISKMKIESAQEEKKAHFLEVEGGKVLSQNIGAREKGTTIEINALFYNVPARKKFQKSVNANVAMIKRTVDLLALANPHIVLTLKVQDATVLSTQKYEKTDLQKSSKSRICDVLGEKYFDSLIELSFVEGPFSFRGYIGLPSYAKKTRGGQYLFINQRGVFSPIVSNGIREGYGTAISDGYHPLFVIYLDMPPDFVDVNVHPQKKEVRLRDEFFLKEKIKEATSFALQGNNCITEESSHVSDFSYLSPKESFFQKVDTTPFIQQAYSIENSPVQEELFSLEENNREKSSYAFHELGLIGQYLLVEMKNFSAILSRFTNQEEEMGGLLFVDLQASSARILYDAISGQMGSEPIISQQLLFPITMDLASDEILQVSEHLEDLSNIGVEARIIGDKTLAIDALPFFIKEEETVAFVSTLLEELSLIGKVDKAKEQYKKRVARKITSFAKAQNKSFEMDEACALFEKLLHSKDKYHDPLGNPTMIRLTKQQIEIMFKQKGALSS